ncbi:Dpy-30 motif-domain-containing protein [Hyaloraphidium curvatum]|nr:Dpy-30 motif-domain-containing protein [Hyaloraphidium curvatum]
MASQDPGPLSAMSISTEPDLQNLPPRQYLDQTVVPTLLDGLKNLVHERPAKPLEWLAQYLMEQSKSFESSKKNNA